MTNQFTPLPDSPYKHMWVPELRAFTTAKIGESDYMALSKAWKNLREKRLQKDGYQCQKCGSAINVQVHHIRYPDAWGHETIDDLVTLCDSCHKEIHNK